MYRTASGPTTIVVNEELEGILGIMLPMSEYAIECTPSFRKKVLRIVGTKRHRGNDRRFYVIGFYWHLSSPL